MFSEADYSSIAYSKDVLRVNQSMTCVTDRLLGTLGGGMWIICLFRWMIEIVLGPIGRPNEDMHPTPDHV